MRKEGNGDRGGGGVGEGGGAGRGRAYLDCILRCNDDAVLFSDDAPFTCLPCLLSKI